MIALPLSAAAGLGALEAAPGVTEVVRITIDSRTVRPGDLFVAVGGGATYLEAARAAGAAATLLPDDEHAALAALGRAVLARSSARVVGITGSNGKTSTKDILAALCAPLLRTVAAERSFNNEIGVPVTLFRVEPDTELVILELAMRGAGHIAALCQIAPPDVAAITSIAPAHLELLGSLESIARAKAEIVEGLRPEGVAVVPAHVDELEQALAEVLRRRPVRVVRVGGAQLPRRVGAVERRPDGSCRAEFLLADERVTLDLSFSSGHQLANTLTALVVYRELGLPLERAQEGAAQIRFSSWRGEEHALAGGGLVVNDAYNANPGSLRAALEHQQLRAAGRRRLAVLGTMAELGPTAPEHHRAIGRFARELGVDQLIAVGELGRHYLDEGPPGQWAPDAAAAIEAARACVRPGDHVLVKASRSVGLESVAEALAADSAADALRGF